MAEAFGEGYIYSFLPIFYQYVTDSSDLTKVNYTDPSIHLPEEELFIGDDVLFARK